MCLQAAHPIQLRLSWSGISFVFHLLWSDRLFRIKGQQDQEAEFSTDKSETRWALPPWGPGDRPSVGWIQAIGPVRGRPSSKCFLPQDFWILTWPTMRSGLEDVTITISQKGFRTFYTKSTGFVVVWPFLNELNCFSRVETVITCRRDWCWKLEKIIWRQANCCAFNPQKKKSNRFGVYDYERKPGETQLSRAILSRLLLLSRRFYKGSSW